MDLVIDKAGAKNCPWHRLIRPPGMAEIPFLQASTGMYLVEQCREQLPRAKHGHSS